MSASVLINGTSAITFVWLAGACLNSAVIAEAAADAIVGSESEREAGTHPVLETWRRVLRKTRINSARTTPFSGLYELVLDNRVIYADVQGRYLLFGEIYDTRQGGGTASDTPTTAETIPWNHLPLTVAVRDRWKDDSNDTRQKLAVLFDPWCSDCPRLYSELANARDIDTHFLILAPNDKDGEAIVGGILCSRDPWLALYQTMHDPDLRAKRIDSGAFALLDVRPTQNQYVTAKRLGNERYAFEDVCDRAAAVAEVNVFARSAGLRNLPALIAHDGRVHHGYLPLEELRAWLAHTP